MLYDANNQPITFGYYPDNMPLYRGGNDLSTIRFQYDVDAPQEFLALLLLVHSEQLAGRKVNHLCVPFLPGARQDRVNEDGGDVLQAARVVCKMLNAFDVHSRAVLDPHSHVSAHALRAILTHHASHVAAYAESMLAGYTGIIAPDQGAVDRAAAVAATLRLRWVRANKVRNSTTGKLTDFTCPPLAPGRWLVVDDICDGGGTFLGLATTVLMENEGVSLDLFVSHGLFTQGVEKLLDMYQRIYTTDSVVSHIADPRLTVIPYCKECMV